MKERQMAQSFPSFLPSVQLDSWSTQKAAPEYFCHGHRQRP